MALEEIDTRALVRRLRANGAMRCALGTASAETLHARALAEPHLDWPRMLAEPELASPPPALEACVSEPYSVGAGPRVVVLDLGCKRSIVSRLVESGLEAVVVPGDWDADAVLELDPAAVLIGNGPGDPAQLDGPVETVRELLGRVPLFGICLGHQLVGLALGLNTFKLPFGHRGANHPVRVTGSEPRARDRPEPRLRGRAGRRRRGQPRLAQRRHRRGARGRRLRDAAVPPRGRAGPARRPSLLRPDRHGVPKRTDLRSILIVGSGPIRIGQGCEFDYAGVQACRALRAEGYRVVLANSNPATIMTDPEWADATYLEPLDAPTLAEIVARESPDALLPTLGGQTALNLAVELAESGVLAEHGVELIGADLHAIRTAEDRSLFRTAMEAAGLPVPVSVVVTSLDAARRAAPSRRSCGPRSRSAAAAAGSPARDRSCASASRTACAASPIGQVLVERSLEGWQEFELEVVVDSAGNCIVVCSIENLDPIGVHTGDSWTVAPQQTLPDGELQRLRDAAFACARAVGVATGGANVQFAYEPETRELALIEMNPRVSRSSALASKATGFPIAKLAALLAVGLHARRAAERHHRRLQRGVRAGARLRRREGAALRLREVPRQLAGARHGDARGRRGTRPRPDVPGGAAEGARGRRGRRRAAGDPRPPSVLRRRARVDPRRRARARR